MAEKKNTYWRDFVAELKKVVWPTRKQVINNTLLTLTVTAIFAGVVLAFDEVLYKGFQFFWDSFGKMIK